MSADHEKPEPATVEAPDAVLSGEDSEEEPVETYSDLDDSLVEDFEETTHNTGNSFTPAQLATIETTVQSSGDLCEFFHLLECPFHGRHTSLERHTASASRNSNSSGLAPSVRKEFGRQNPTG